MTRLGAWLRGSRPSPTGLAIAATVVVYAVLAQRRWWIADDGMIVVRTAREIIAGHGPVFSSIERAEASTSALWTWLVAGAGWITGDVVAAAIVLGGALAVGGLALALDATRRLHRASGHSGALIPAGAGVVLAVFPFWDYATSGLEIGLVIGWLGAIWWGFVAVQNGHVLGTGRAPRRLAGFALALGLGPLVRPELSVATAVFLIAAIAIARPPLRRALGLIGLAAIAPVAYEVFRAGYYGCLVPLPALAKSADAAEWARGARYLKHFLWLELLYVPLAALVAAAVAQRRTLVAPHAIAFAAPVITAALIVGFLVRVGGDFMFGRLLLPAALLTVAPVLVVPVRRATVAAAIVVAAWGLAVAFWYAGDTHHPPADERAWSTTWTGVPHPTERDYHHAVAAFSAEIDQALHAGQRVVFFESGERMALGAAHAAPLAVVGARLGMSSSVAPVDAIVVDRYGLANPIGARITRTQPGRTGHEKLLPAAWVIADLCDPADAPAPVEDRAAIAAARHALTCGELAELVASVRAPMTPSRFWDNLTGAARRTRLVIPADPRDAERQFCGSGAATSASVH
jgi:arabinofuranosyltransferase